MSQQSSPFVGVSQQVSLVSARLVQSATPVTSRIAGANNSNVDNVDQNISPSPSLLRRSPKLDLTMCQTPKTAAVNKQIIDKKEDSMNVLSLCNSCIPSNNSSTRAMNSVQKQKFQEMILKQQREQLEFEKNKEINAETTTGISLIVSSKQEIAKIGIIQKDKLGNGRFEYLQQCPGKIQQAQQQRKKKKQLMSITATAPSAAVLAPRLNASPSKIASYRRQKNEAEELKQPTQFSSHFGNIRCENGMTQDQQFLQEILPQEHSNLLTSYKHILSSSEQFLIEDIELAAAAWENQQFKCNTNSLSSQIPLKMSKIIKPKPLKLNVLQTTPFDNTQLSQLDNKDFSKQLLVKIKPSLIDQQSSWQRVSPQKQRRMETMLQEKLEQSEDSLATTACLSALSTSTPQSLSQQLHGLFSSPQDNNNNPICDMNKIKTDFTNNSSNLDSSCEDNRQPLNEGTLVQ